LYITNNFCIDDPSNASCVGINNYLQSLAVNLIINKRFSKIGTCSRLEAEIKCPKIKKKDATEGKYIMRVFI